MDKASLIQFDDFAPDLDQVRSDLIAANPFATVTGPNGMLNLSAVNGAFSWRTAAGCRT